MMAFVGQVSTLYALPASFFCLTATMPSGHHNTHQPLPHHPLTLCYLWHWWQHLTTVTWQWWCNVAVTMDVHNDNQWPRMMRRMRWATMDNNKDVQVLPSSPCPPPLIDPYVVLASHSIFSQLHTCFPYVRSSETGWDWDWLRLRLVETGLSTDKNQQKPHWTGWHSFSPVFQGSSACEDQSWSRSCQILTKDWTGLDFQALHQQNLIFTCRQAQFFPWHHSFP